MPTILGANSDTGAYDVANSLQFNGQNQYMSRTPGSAGNRRTFTFSAWIKVRPEATSRALMSTGDNSGSNDYIMFQSGDKLRFSFGTEGNGDIITDGLFRDPAAWYHIVWAVDTTQGTASNRVKLYVNGTQETNVSGTYPDQNYDTSFNNTVVQRIGARSYSATQYYDGYMSEINLVDGSQLDASYFGETNDNGIWVPKQYTGSYGTNGFFMEFQQTGTSQNSSGIGADTSGNDNHFAVSALGANSPALDTPTNNYCTLNVLYKATTGSTNQPTVTDGMISVAYVGDSSIQSTFGMASGKWYFEVRYNSGQVDGYPQIGYSKSGGINAGEMVGFHTPSGSNYRAKVAGTVISNAFDGTISSNDIMGFYMDIDNGTLIVHKNGSDFMGSGATNGLDFSSTAFSNDTGFFHVHYNTNANSAHSEDFNFGGAVSFTVSSAESDANGHGKFEYSPTIGGVNYYALNSKNLAEFG